MVIISRVPTALSSAEAIGKGLHEVIPFMYCKHYASAEERVPTARYLLLRLINAWVKFHAAKVEIWVYQVGRDF